MKYKEYKVIEVVNNTTLLINYGFADNAHKGDSFRIIEKGDPVVVDGVDYGTLDMVKDVVEVIVPYEKFSICRKVLYKTVNALNPLEALQRTMTQLRPLTVDPKDVTNRVIPIPSPIKKGDIAILTQE